MNSINRSTITLIFCSLILALSPFLVKKWTYPYNSVLSHDAAGYYLYLPAFFYDDLGKIYKADYLIKNYDPFGCNFKEANHQVNGNYIIKYTCGVALLQIPGFVIGHIWAKLTNMPVDGFSLPYQVAMNFWGIAFAIFGLWITSKNLLRYFSDLTTSFVLLIICLSTNLYNYIAFGAVVSHTYLFTIYALLIYFIDSFYFKSSVKKIFAIGILMGLAVLIRPTEIVGILLLILWKTGYYKDFIKRIRFFLLNFKYIVIFVISAFIAGSIQLLYWKIYTGKWIFWSYGTQETFNFLEPHLINGFISYKKGWLMYTPVMILSLIGMFHLFKKDKRLFFPIFLFFCVNTYIIFSWNEWWYGGSFSQRAIIQSYAILVFPLAAFVEFVQKRSYYAYITVLFVSLCIWLNLNMTYQCHSTKNIMENTLMSKKYYWKIFGKTSIDKNDKKYIELEEEIPNKHLQDLKPIYINNFEQETESDTISAFSGKRAILLNKEKQSTKDFILPINNNTPGYYRAVLTVFANEMEWNIWTQAQFIIAFQKNGKAIKTNFYRIYRIIDIGKWQPITIDIKTPSNPDYNELKVSVWNANSEKTLLVDDLKIDFVRK